MEDQTEKMEALKKVYANIILSTAKEAAARALESERKALRIHHDLRNTKDEALRMLLRFKHMIDLKTTEAETTALSQQNRIRELDAQLNETEGVIIDLRSEIRIARERLEEMKNSHMLQENTDVAEHYKSVYTHRIRAIERSISKEKELRINVDEKNTRKRALFSVDTENKDTKSFNGSEALFKDQTVKTQRQSNHKLSRFGHENLNLEERSNRNDAKLTENNENITSSLRRSIRKRKVRCWDEISSSFKLCASLSNNETKYETAAKESDGVTCDTDSNKKPYILIDDSSSESRNLIDVACQLISLSGEHSW